MSSVKDITGQRFGRLVVLHISHKDARRNYYWVCQCDCGNIATIRVSHLKNGNTTSCGCYDKERRWKHGYAAKCKQNHDPAYGAWTGMISRCTDPNVKNYSDYGGRGIYVCDRWRKSFLFFLEDMGERPGRFYSVDRMDNDGNYCPENCRWATPKEQSNNKRNNIYFEYQGKRQSIEEWSKELGVNKQTLFTRYSKGWPVDRILNPHVRARDKKRSFDTKRI